MLLPEQVREDAAPGRVVVEEQDQVAEAHEHVRAGGRARQLGHRAVDVTDDVDSHPP